MKNTRLFIILAGLAIFLFVLAVNIGTFWSEPFRSSHFPNFTLSVVTLIIIFCAITLTSYLTLVASGIFTKFLIDTTKESKPEDATVDADDEEVETTLEELIGAAAFFLTFSILLWINLYGTTPVYATIAFFLIADFVIGIGLPMINPHLHHKTTTSGAKAAESIRDERKKDVTTTKEKEAAPKRNKTWLIVIIVFFIFLAGILLYMFSSSSDVPKPDSKPDSGQTPQDTTATQPAPKSTSGNGTAQPAPNAISYRHVHTETIAKETSSKGTKISDTQAHEDLLQKANSK